MWTPAARAERPRTTLAILVTLLLGLSWAVSAGADSESSALERTEPTPDPDLGPGEVVRIQLQALRESRGAQSGIGVAFRFASPSNRQQTGPLERFSRMIRQGRYRLMLSYREAEYAPVEIQGERARQRVTLYSATEAVTYVFMLSRQTDMPYENCWMTDAVFVQPSRKLNA